MKSLIFTIIVIILTLLFNQQYCPLKYNYSIKYNSYDDNRPTIVHNYIGPI